MEDESRAVCVSMCLFVFVSVCFCIYLLLSVYVFIATCVIVRLHCVIREPGGCEGGREQSREGEKLNQGFAERALPTSAKNPDEKYKSRIASLGSGCACLSCLGAFGIL